MATKQTKHHRCVANGIKFHYAEAGEGPPVVLLHGFPETSYAWRYQIEALKTRYRLIVPDLRGYGAGICGIGDEGSRMALLRHRPGKSQLRQAGGIRRHKRNSRGSIGGSPAGFASCT